MSNNPRRDTNSFQELIQQFLNDPESEVNKRRLQEILDEEMNKPEDQIDLQLVDEILAVGDAAFQQKCEKTRQV